MSEASFSGGGYVTPPGITTIDPALPPVVDPDRPDPFYLEGLRLAVHMFEPLDGTREMGSGEDAVWWGNVTRYADAMATYLRNRTRR